MLLEKDSPFGKTTAMAEDKDITVIPLQHQSLESTPQEAPPHQSQVTAKSDNFPAMARWRRKTCAQVCLKVFFVVLGIVTMVSLKYGKLTGLGAKAACPPDRIEEAELSARKNPPMELNKIFATLQLTAILLVDVYLAHSSPFSLCFGGQAATCLIICIASIIVTISSSVANKLYDAEQSGHLIVMVVLAVLSAATICIIIYAILGICRTDVKSLYMTGFLFFILAIIQALLTGLAVNVTDADQLTVGKALAVSFNQSQHGSQKHMKLWEQTQYDLECCGVYGAEDYRPYKIPSVFPPDVPISCCPTYNPNFPEHAQERARELCKANKDYYSRGCKPVIQLIFNESALVVVIVTSVLILFEVLLAISAAFISRRNEALISKKLREV